MAALPPIRRIFREDLGPDVPQWITRLLAPLNLVLDTVYQALNKNLEFGVNIRSQVREFQLVAGAASADNTFDFPVELNGKKPQGLWIISVQRTDGTSEAFTHAPYASWQWNSQANTIEITGISGLTNAVVYSIRVLVI